MSPWQKEEFEHPARKTLSLVTMIITAMLTLLAGYLVYGTQRAYEIQQARADLYAGLVENYGSPFIVVNHDGKIIEWNPAAERDLGWSRQEVVGSDLLFLMAGPELRYRHMQLWRDPAMVHEKLQGKTLRATCWVSRRDGKPMRASIEIRSVNIRGNWAYTAQVDPLDSVESVDLLEGVDPPEPPQPGPRPQVNFNTLEQLRDVVQDRSRSE